MIKTAKIISKIKRANAVCFDVFDTLLIRPYVKPTDMFFHMEKCLNSPGFAKARISAESTARSKTKKSDITLDDIYAEIDDAFKKYYKHELDWEFMVLRPNPEILEIWDAARKSGKQIIIASDMYLPTEFIADVLNKNGFKGYDKIYVSGDLDIAKYNGTMFKTVIRDTSIKPSKILHIGDNKKSDYIIPRRLGINAVKIDKLVERYIKSDSRTADFLSKQRDDLGSSILVSLLTIYNSQKRKIDNYWYKFGYEYAGPVIYGYTRWLESMAVDKNLKHLLFVARDGYTLQRIFNTFNDSIKNSYVYAPRFINLVYRLNFKSGNSPVAVAQQNTIIEHYCKQDKDLAKIYKKYDFKNNTPENFLLQNMSKLKILANDGFKIYSRYINDYIFKSKHESFGIVDTITENYSAQNLIQSTVKNDAKAFGLYWCAVKNRENKYATFSDTCKKHPIEYIKNWGIMEFLMTSPEIPIEGISKDFNPIYKKHISDDEKFIRQIYPSVSDGATDFAKFTADLFSGKDIYLTYDCLVSWINCFCAMPNKQDFYHVGKIRTSSNPNNNCYNGLFRDEFFTWYKIRHPFAYYKKMKSFMWHTPCENVILCLLHPISLHIHGFSDIKVYIFPKIKYKLFELSVKPGRNSKWTLIFGGKK